MNEDDCNKRRRSELIESSGEMLGFMLSFFFNRGESNCESENVKRMLAMQSGKSQRKLHERNESCLPELFYERGRSF